MPISSTKKVSITPAAVIDVCAIHQVCRKRRSAFAVPSQVLLAEQPQPARPPGTRLGPASREHDQGPGLSTSCGRESSVGDVESSPAGAERGAGTVLPHAGRRAVPHGARQLGDERVHRHRGQRPWHHCYRGTDGHHPLHAGDGHVHDHRRQDRGHRRPPPRLLYRLCHLWLRLSNDVTGP